MNAIAENIAQIHDQITAACDRVERDPQEVTLIAVTKTHPAALVQAAIEGGVQHFGENRVEEGVSKIAEVGDPKIHWHLIGHLQSRKSKDLFRTDQPGLWFTLMHSLDSVKLADKLSRLGIEHGITVPVLLQINVSGEQSKEGFDGYGWSIDEAVQQRLWAEVLEVCLMPNLQVYGLMTIPPIVDRMEDARPFFRNLRRLRDALQDTLQLSLPALSMGMSDDYPIAIEEGATLIRIGRAIFGER
ncbi:MAG: YggS family pyridoxal phosphate-dependent enzyme [Anaerolineae bacterium]|jgi:hypothetical protein|nr:YggS family pyridoxal phosphate-dependent enzyme [Anaerolineae bacterium]